MYQEMRVKISVSVLLLLSLLLVLIIGQSIQQSAELNWQDYTFQSFPEFDNENLFLAEEDCFIPNKISYPL